MFVEERHEKILQLLHENGKIKVKELSEMFQVTEDCIRKDLAGMEKQNLLKRTYGGAVERENLHPGHSQIVSSRKSVNLNEKQKIAKKAVKLLKDGDVIFLDISTTNIELAKEIIKSGMRVTVVSCMLDIANIFATGTEAEFIMLGGAFNRSQSGFLGSMTSKMMEPFRFDKCFMGVVGMDMEEKTVMTYVPEDAGIKQGAVERSSQVYLVMETEKFGFRANYVYAHFSDVSGVICETLPAEEIQKVLKENQIRLI